MTDRLFADAIMLLHGAFILFAVFGGGLVLWRRAWAWVHLPAVLWAGWIELSGGICPLTPLEGRLRTLGGQGAHEGDFLDRCLAPLIYPEGLNREIQLLLGLAVLLLNGAIYVWIWRRRRGERRSSP